MNWFIIALITPITHAASNHIDKHFISKYFRGGQVGSLVLFSALFAVVGLPIILLIDSNVFSISAQDAALLMFNGFLLVLAYICYFYALEQDEASLVAPLFQLIPIFGFILGYFFLGESLTRMQLIGSFIVILGAVIISLDLDTFKVKKMVILLMSGSSILYAINAVLFKFVTADLQRFWPSLFWDFAGKVLFGILIFLFIKSYRRQFVNVLKTNGTWVLSLNVFNEVLAVVGEAALVFAAIIAPVALAQVVSGFQPAFVFLFGILLTLFLPSFGKESLVKKHLVQKVFAIAIIILGSTMLNF
jgi:drug/metabolite transporter (DMT)-like permease